MTKTDFFRLLIKLLGLYLITLIPYTFSSLVSLVAQGFEVMIVLYVLIMIVLYILFAVMLIGFPDVIIRFLKLDKGFDNNEINISSVNTKKIICLAVIIVGGLLVVYNFSAVVVTIGSIFASLISRPRGEIFPAGMFTESLIVELLDFVIGLFLVFNYNRIAGYVLKKEE